MKSTSLLTDHDRADQLNTLQEKTDRVFDLLTGDHITVEQGRLALEFLQLATDLVDLSDSLARRQQTK
jgi:hypothetical protein